MSVNNRKGPVYDPGLCRCCGASKKCRVLNVEYDWMGQKEVYADMFVDCFGLLLSHLEGEATERLICATCVTRLREASSFRKQVLQWEERLLKTQIHVHGDGNEKINEIKKELEDIKVEVSALPLPASAPEETPCDDPGGDDVMDYGDDDPSEDFQPVQKAKATKKTPKLKKSIGTRVKRKTKKKKEKQNGEEKSGELSEREKMLQNIAKISETLRMMHEEELKEKPPPVRKTTDNEQKSFINATAIVQNSYVCPFDSSFSDYYCIYCREVFTDPNKLREHTLTHDPITFKEHAVNKKQIQLDLFRIDCRLCAKRIDDLEVFKSHVTTVHGVKMIEGADDFLKFRLTLNNLQCLECNCSFGFFHALKKHMAEHFGTCICDVCGAHYFEERMLLLHQKSHQKVDENFPCKECGKNFKSKHSRYLHMARTHRKEPTYQCSKCDEVFFSYSLRYRHMIESHGEQRMFPCEHCDRAYDSRKSLREHNRRFHLKIFRHQCDLCEKRFYLPSRLREHMATHTGERNYRCEYCGKTYPRLRGLKVHVQSHSADKKYKCDLCTASFTQNVNLRTHVRRQHQHPDPYAE